MPDKLMHNPYATHIDFFQFKGMIASNPKAHPCNIDMIFERRSKFLVGEWKRENETISKGQEILLKALAKRHKFSVLIISGNTDSEMVVHKFWKLNADGSFMLKGDGTQAFKDYLTDWYLMADFD